MEFKKDKKIGLCVSVDVNIRDKIQDMAYENNVTKSRIIDVILKDFFQEESS